MRHHRAILAFVALLVLSFSAEAQRGAGAAQRDSAPVATPAVKELSSVTERSVRVGGQLVPYRATASTMNIENERGELIGSIYYTAYTRTDVKEGDRRPLAFVYNGGPGAASLWLHMGAFGPRKVVTPDAMSAPPGPYQLADNANSLIDVTDMVFIDPVGTGYSRPVGRGTGADFWGVDEDAASLASFVRQYVTRNKRWTSPKYLIGESYGTTRSAVLVNRLQSNEAMDFNGVVLISAVLDFETLRFAPGHDISYVLYLPSYAITAAYHGMIPKPRNMQAFLDEVRQYAIGPYAVALAKGSALPAAERTAVQKQVAAYTGLSEDYLAKADLRVNLSQFRAELQRAKGLNTGRLDSRYTGALTTLLAETADYDPQSTGISAAYTAAMNHYVRDELKFESDARYSISGGVQPWNWNRAPAARGGGGGSSWIGATYVGTDLAQALIRNRHLRVEIENGLYDLATPFFAIEHTVDHLPIPAEARRRIQHKYYDAGHMMYTLDPALEQLKSNIARFIAATAQAGRGATLP